MEKSKVALVRGESRYSNVAEALALIAEDVHLADKKGLLVKVNFVSTSHQAAATHVDAVRALLDFLRARYQGPIVIGEGAAVGDTFDGFRNFGYLDLMDQYGVALLDLNQDDWVEVQVYDRGLRPLSLRAARSAVESDYRIAIGPPKTHDSVIVTLSLKNMIVGSMIRDRYSRQGDALLHRTGQVLPPWLKESPLLRGIKRGVARAVSRSDKSALHQGYPAMNLNLYTLAKVMAPHLAIIDGFVAMEGNGPSYGDLVDWRLAMVSTDFLAADALGTTLMGFNPDEVGYLHYCKLGGLGKGDLEEIEILGNTAIEECARNFRPHSNYERTREWRIHHVERFL